MQRAGPTCGVRLAVLLREAPRRAVWRAAACSLRPRLLVGVGVHRGLLGPLLAARGDVFGDGDVAIERLEQLSHGLVLLWVRALLVPEMRPPGRHLAYDAVRAASYGQRS